MAIAIQPDHPISNNILPNSGMCVQTVLFILLEVPHFPLHTSKSSQAATDIQRERTRTTQNLLTPAHQKFNMSQAFSQQNNSTFSTSNTRKDPLASQQ